MELRYIIKLLLLPPGSILALLFCGLLFISMRRVSFHFLLAGFLLFYCLSIPAVSYFFSTLIEKHPIIKADSLSSTSFAEYGAVIVLAAGVREQAEEFGGPTVNAVGAWRTRYGAYLSKAIDVPLMMSGGTPLKGAAGSAELMEKFANEELNTTTRWVEGDSRTTWESALAAKGLLRDEGVDKIILVTDAWHMARSVESFQAVGFEVLAAPTLEYERDQHRSPLVQLLPALSALNYNSQILHEALGLLWYRFRYF